MVPRPLALMFAAALTLTACYATGVLTYDEAGNPLFVQYAETASCASGRCAHACPEGGFDCVFSCSGGGCHQICEADSACHFTCSGGGCVQRCMPGARCRAACSGGGCDQACASPHLCGLSCSGGGCVVDGQ